MRLVSVIGGGLVALSALGALTAPVARASGESSGGGGAVVCRDANGAITSAEMLDLFEGRVRFQHRPYEHRFDGVAKNSGQVVEQALYAGINNGGVFNHPARNTEKLYHRVMKIRSRIQMLPPGIAIETSNDLGSRYAVLIKAGCAVETVGYYEWDGSIKVVPEVFDRLDPVNQAAFFLHETIYQILRDYAGDTDSSRAREMTSLLITDTWGEARRPLLVLDDVLMKIPSPVHENSLVLRANACGGLQVKVRGPAEFALNTTAGARRNWSRSRWDWSSEGQVSLRNGDIGWEDTMLWNCPDYLELDYRADTVLPLSYEIIVDGKTLMSGTLSENIERFVITYK